MKCLTDYFFIKGSPCSNSSGPFTYFLTP